MFGKKFTIFSFILLFLLISFSIFLRISERYTLSNIIFSSSIAIFIIISWIQRKIKEDMLPFVSDEYKKKEWRYYFSSLLSFLLLLFTTMLNIFILFFGLNISRAMINILLGSVLLLMLYTVFSIPTVEKNAIYTIFFIFAIIFPLIVIGSQLDIYHLPENISPLFISIADPLFLVNIALISYMASCMAGGEMPSPIDAVIGMRERGRIVREKIVLRKNILYISIIILIASFIIINLLTIIKLPRIKIAGLQWGYVLITISILLLFSIILYVIFLLPERKEKEGEAFNKIAVVITSAIVSAIFIVIAILIQIGKMHIKYLSSIDFAIYAILTMIGPFGFYEYTRYKKINSMEERFPEFLRDLAESRKAGMTMAKAVEMAAKGDYGHLTPEIKKMAVQISWGLPFSEALKRFGERIKTPLIQRTTAMVVKASESGGKIADVIEAAAKNVREIKILQSERKTEMKMYLMIIYIAFFVFLAVIIALSGMFLPKLLQASQQAAGIAGMGGARAGIEEYKFIYICTALSQAIGNGIVAGSLAEGKAIAGLRHATIMILITYLVFKLIL